jgi:hypothetical protein
MCLLCSADAREHEAVDDRGKVWRFEMHHFCGPIVLRKDGDPVARQPGDRSAFWQAFDRWQAANPERRA